MSDFAENSASPAAHKDADKRIGLHGRIDRLSNLGQDTSVQTQLGSYQRYQNTDYGRLQIAFVGNAHVHITTSSGAEPITFSVAA